MTDFNVSKFIIMILSFKKKYEREGVFRYKKIIKN